MDAQAAELRQGCRTALNHVEQAVSEGQGDPLKALGSSLRRFSAPTLGRSQIGLEPALPFGFGELLLGLPQLVAELRGDRMPPGEVLAARLELRAMSRGIRGKFGLQTGASLLQFAEIGRAPTECVDRNVEIGSRLTLRHLSFSRVEAENPPDDAVEIRPVQSTR